MKRRDRWRLANGWAWVSSCVSSCVVAALLWLGGCSGSHGPGDASPPARDAGLDAGPLSFDAGPDGGGRDGGAVDAGSLPDAGPMPDAGPWLDAGTCTAERAALANDLAPTRIAELDACFDGSVDLDRPAATLDYGWVPSFGPAMFVPLLCDSPANRAAASLREGAIRDLLRTDPELLCASGVIGIRGGLETERSELGSRATRDCIDIAPSSGQFRVSFNDRGAVTAVAFEPADPALEECVRRSLMGARFPCLAAVEVCGEIFAGGI